MHLYSIVLNISSLHKQATTSIALELEQEYRRRPRSSRNPYITKLYDVEVGIIIESDQCESIDPKLLEWLIKKYVDEAVTEARHTFCSHLDILDQR